MEFGTAVRPSTVGVPERGRALRTKCPEDFMLLWSFAHITSLIIYELYKISKGGSNLLVGSVIVTHSVSWIEPFQGLLLSQMNESTTTLGKNYQQTCLFVKC